MGGFDCFGSNPPYTVLSNVVQCVVNNVDVNIQYIHLFECPNYRSGNGCPGTIINSGNAPANS